MTDKKEKEVHEMEPVTSVIQPTEDGQVYTLIRPFSLEGDDYSRFNLDFEELTGHDIMKAEAELKAFEGKKDFEFIPVMALHRPFQAAIAAKAAGVPVHVIFAAKGRDFNNICDLAQRFLLSTD